MALARPTHPFVVHGLDSGATPPEMLVIRVGGPTPVQLMSQTLVPTTPPPYTRCMPTAKGPHSEDGEGQSRIFQEPSLALLSYPLEYQPITVIRSLRVAVVPKCNLVTALLSRACLLFQPLKDNNGQSRSVNGPVKLKLASHSMGQEAKILLVANGFEPLARTPILASQALVCHQRIVDCGLFAFL